MKGFFNLSQDIAENPVFGHYFQNQFFLQYLGSKIKFQKFVYEPQNYYPETFKPNMEPLPYPVWAVGRGRAVGGLMGRGGGAAPSNMGTPAYK